MRLHSIAAAALHLQLTVLALRSVELITPNTYSFLHTTTNIATAYKNQTLGT